jgi:ferredoxin/flavodoxin
MNYIRSLLGRRQFLVTAMGSAVLLVFKKIAKVIDLLPQPGTTGASEKNAAGQAAPLKGIVVYYSATASTAKIARAIHRGMKSIMPCDVAPVKKIAPEDMARYDVVAIGAPIWLHREPANVKIFTSKMPRMDGKQCILFTTHGTQPFSIFWSMSRNLLRKGLTIIGWNDWYGDATHVLHATQPYITWGHPDEIDLKEAEVFGREMAERALRIADGEKNLVPEIPIPADSQSTLWTPHWMDGHIMYGGLPPARPGSPDPNEVPQFDLTRCVYPRCTLCVDNCPASAIDLSLALPAARTNTPLVVKEACQHCGGLCARMCAYDAVTYIGERTRHAIDMTRCIYPECTLCVDECLMDAIDFSHDPPVVHENCEGCDVCWCICPVEGASIITNLEKSQYLHIPTKYVPPDIVEKYKLQDPPGMNGMPMPPVPGGGGASDGGGPEGEGGMQGMRMPKFRQLIPDEEVGKDGYVIFSPKVPKIVLNKSDWPHEVAGG